MVADVNPFLLRTAFWFCVALVTLSVGCHLQAGEPEVLAAIQVPFMALALGAAGLTIKVGKDGLEINAASEARAAASILAAESKKNLPPSSESDMRRMIRRLSRPRRVRVLWVDDQPENNIDEMRALMELGFSITAVPSTEAARAILFGGLADVVISDMDRNGKRDAGVQFADDVRASGSSVPIVIYRGRQDELSAKALAAGARKVTTTPRELLVALDAALSAGV
jgi:CheY-like chemotaxis protein